MTHSVNQSRLNRVAFTTIVTKEIRRFLRIWPQTLLPPAITTTLYFIVFGKLIGSRIGQIDGFNYMQFIVPGLIMMTVITNSYANVVSSYYSAKFQKNIEELIVSPTPPYITLAGFIVGGMARGILVGIIVLLISLLFTHISIVHIGITIITLLLASALFAIGGFINAIYAKSFDDISIVPTFVLTPLTYLGGVFYSIKQLPEIWQHVSMFNPIVYIVNAFRYGILGYSEINVTAALVTTLLLATAAFGFSLHLLNTGKGTRE